MKKYILSIFCMILLSSSLVAGVEVRNFQNEAQEALFKELVAELRCLVCQNQNLADSNAELALDLKQQVYLMITEKGMDRQQIIQYMVERYGDFVLYKPPVRKSTWLLWFGPLLFLLLGFVVIWRTVRNNRQQPVGAMDDKKRQEMQQLLREEAGEKS